MGKLILLRNCSTVVKPLDVDRMVTELNLQAVDLAQAHNRTVPTYVVQTTFMPDLTLELLDSDPSSPDELGDHSVDENGNPVGRVLCVPSLMNGTGDVLKDVCPVVSHEGCEGFIDPFANFWCATNDGRLIALEVGDPDQGRTYPSGDCLLSNFMWPEYFDPTKKGVHTNFMKTELAPCAVAANGYALYMTSGEITPVFGELVAPEKRVSALLGRFGRRLRKHSKAKHAHHLAAAWRDHLQALSFSGVREEPSLATRVLAILSPKTTATEKTASADPNVRVSPHLPNKPTWA